MFPRIIGASGFEPRTEKKGTTSESAATSCGCSAFIISGSLARVPKSPAFRPANPVKAGTVPVRSHGLSFLGKGAMPADSFAIKNRTFKSDSNRLKSLSSHGTIRTESRPMTGVPSTVSPFRIPSLSPDPNPVP
jgi:hypothetical protein